MKNKKIDIKKLRRRWQKAAKRIFLILLIIVLIIAIVSGGTFLILRQRGKKSILPDLSQNKEYYDTIEYEGHTYKYNDDLVSIAFLGIDQYDLDNPQSNNFAGANDANIVASIDTETGEMKLVAIPRDTMAEVDIYRNGKYIEAERNQLCLAYAYGEGGELSCENTITSISRVLDNVPIEKYYALDMSGISAINDAIGGVILKSEIDMPSYGVKVGDIVTLKGKMAEGYVRQRSHDYLEASLDRTERQVKYLQSFAEQTVPAIFLDFSKLNDLYNVGAEYSRTNITLSEITYLANLLRSKGTTTFKDYTIKGTMNSSEALDDNGSIHAEFTPDEDELMKTILDVFYIRIA